MVRQIAVCGVLLALLVFPGSWFPFQEAAAQQATQGITPVQGTAPTSNPASTTWQYARKDEAELIALGGGSLEKGMNQLGEMGYELFIVTSIIDSGKAGYHFFRRPPCCRPGMDRPKIEYRRLDTMEITAKGKGNYQDGLIALETDRWELVAVTTTTQGAVAFHYFLRYVK